ncbi:MAG: DUF711 family protein [Anaerolineales bacterium]
MKIRAITFFDNPGSTIQETFIERATQFVMRCRAAFKDAELEVQTIRFASPPFPLFLKDLSSPEQIAYAVHLESILTGSGYEYISLGPALPEYPASYQLIPDLIQATNATFCSGVMAGPAGVSLPAVRACGQAIHKLAPQDPNGFANLYFAALGNVPPGAPFFPAAYHSGGVPEFAVAVEAADLALSAFKTAESFQDARQRLIGAIEEAADEISHTSEKVERSTAAIYRGIDFSLAPFPDPALSIGAALESLGIPRLGLHGSLAGTAFLADCIDRANFPHTGFSGLMLPVMEDTILAERAAGGSLSVKDLLLYSAVCGTGLDTVPLPGDCTPEEISSLLTDLAVLSLRLDKPLTARLMPIPGKKAGEPTDFDFPFFANSRILPLESTELGGLFSGGEFLDIRARSGRAD